ncbi:uncharacterized protein LOC132270080 [Cornus florida]|uniref:uncharacterized protein LOC132270080 n=1 Tax=Cornus florida TaxID=4283 RepID=UPI00289EF70D|nr:uncharacterized protein LOC132270080 [Cornus florida]
MTTVVRILAYSYAADHYDEYIKIGESTVIKCLKAFCNAIVAVYAEKYMRPPNEADIVWLLEEGEQRGFLGMLSSIDCMHWEWKNCQVEWQGTHRGRSGKKTLILEAVASQDLWIWHAFFEMPGSHNDINVLDHSLVFNGIVNGQLPPVNYVVNGHHYRMGYYLSDGIYPKLATLMQTIPHPTTTKEKLFAQRQEAARKDVERAFGVLQIKWAIMQGPILWKYEPDMSDMLSWVNVDIDKDISYEEGLVQILDTREKVLSEDFSQNGYQFDPEEIPELDAKRSKKAYDLA